MYTIGRTAERNILYHTVLYLYHTVLYLYYTVCLKKIQEENRTASVYSTT